MGAIPHLEPVANTQYRVPFEHTEASLIKDTNSNGTEADMGNSKSLPTGPGFSSFFIYKYRGFLVKLNMIIVIPKSKAGQNNIQKKHMVIKFRATKQLPR